MERSAMIPALSDKYRRRKPFILLSAGLGVPALFLMAQLSSTTQTYLVSMFTGFFLVAAFPVLLTLNEETTGHGLTGTASAILLLLGNLGGWVLTLLMEAIKAINGGTSFYWSMIFLTGLLAVAFVVALFIREQNSRFGLRGDGTAGDGSTVSVASDQSK
jgi:MFS family permease